MAADSDSPNDRLLLEEMESILRQLGLEDLKNKFAAEKVYASTITLLTDEQIKELGVIRMGDRATLVEACKRACLGSRISQEVKKIMQPSVSLTAQQGSAKNFLGLGTNTVTLPSGSGCKIPVDRRRLKRRSCGSAYKSPSVTSEPRFSKKLFVFRCMDGPGIPKSFTRKEKDIIARGFVSDIYLSATEEEVRQEIHAVLTNSGLSQTVGPNDFEFIDVNGKVAFVPSIKEGFQYSGRIVKQLAGAGSLYIRLLEHLNQDCCKKTKEICIISDNSDDDNDLPQLPFKLQHSEQDGSHNEPSQHCSNNRPHDSASPSERSHLVESKSTESSSVVAQSGDSPAVASVVAACDHTLASSSRSNQSSLPGSSKFSNDVQQLIDPFPNFPEQFISTLYSITNCDFIETFECLLRGDLASVLTLVKDNMMRIDLVNYDSPSIHVPAATQSTEEFDWPIAAFAFYKSHRFNPKNDVSVILGRQPAIDIGGVRRTFFSVVYDKVAAGYLDMFEGPCTRLRPVFRMSVLNSGILKIFGQMVSHNLVMDGVGFPYLSPACYYYMAGKWNTAITLPHR